MKKIGFIVNPIAGMGGSVGLKGTDGLDSVEAAIRMGARPVAYERCRETLRHLEGYVGRLEFICAPDELGARWVKEVGFRPELVDIRYRYRAVSGVRIPATTGSYTKKIVEEFLRKGVDLVLFAGGDGTACDIMDVVQDSVAVLGIPAGVKMYSSVFASTPVAASQVIIKFYQDEVEFVESEVLDVDEIDYRADKLNIRLKGFLKTPYLPLLMQGSKQPTPVDDIDNQKGIADWVVEHMDDDVIYFIGAGTTTAAISKRLNIDYTLLGIDAVLNKELIARDINSEQIKNFINGNNKIIVSPIGAQGFIFGRGNQQFTPEIIREVGKENIIIVATERKLSLSNNILRVDTGDAMLDRDLRGYRRVIVDYNRERAVRVI